MKRSLVVVAVALLSCSPAAPPPPEPMAPLDVPPMPPPTASTRPKTPVPSEPPPPARDPGAAERLFAEGRTAFASGDYATARDRFTKSNELDPATGTLLNLAEAEARLGDTANARRHYQEVFDRATAEGRADRAAFARDKLRALPP